jgi:hypothetical protein
MPDDFDGIPTKFSFGRLPFGGFASHQVLHRTPMPPFTRKEIIRYFIWIAIIAVAVAAIIWFLFHAPGQQSIHLNRGGSGAVRVDRRTASV